MFLNARDKHEPNMKETLIYLTINMAVPVGAGMLLTVVGQPSLTFGLGIGLAVLIAGGNVHRAMISAQTWRWIYGLTTLANAVTLFLFSQLSIFTLAFTAMHVFRP